MRLLKDIELLEQICHVRPGSKAVYGSEELTVSLSCQLDFGSSKMQRMRE
jgi:hypothetical protein